MDLIEAKIAIKKDRLNSLKNSSKNIKCPGVVKRLTREIRNLEKTLNKSEINMELRLLDENYFPCAGMEDLYFQTVDGVIHHGKYDFNNNVNWQRRWIDDEGNEYQSRKDVVKWCEGKK